MGAKLEGVRAGIAGELEKKKYRVWLLSHGSCLEDPYHDGDWYLIQTVTFRANWPVMEGYHQWKHILAYGEWDIKTDAGIDAMAAEQERRREEWEARMCELLSLPAPSKESKTVFTNIVSEVFAAAHISKVKVS